MGRPIMYSPEVRERAVRMVSGEHRGEHRWEWAAICSIAEKFGCGLSSETLRKWVRRAERDQGVRPGLASSDQLTELGELLGGRSGSCAGRMRSCGRLLRISRRRSSTADPADDRLCG